jgi:nucleotide-binding universal stress UspA family protein
MENDKRLLLVPVNFTDYAENGAVYALNLAQYLKADIILLNCYLEPVMAVPGLFEPFTYATINNTLKTIEEEIDVNMKALKQMLEKEKEKAGIREVEINYDLVHGFPDSAILTYADQYNVDAVIMGFEKQEGFSKFGNITANVIEKASVPVIAVPQGYDAYRYKKPENVLYLTRIDDTDLEAMQRLSRLVRFFDSRIMCVHTCLGESSDEEEQEMQKFKKMIVEEYKVENVECGILETGDIVEGLIKFIKRRKIDVLAMNTKKRNLLLRLFKSNFTEKLLYQTNVPLLVYHINH